MKIKSLTLQNYKKFVEPVTFHFFDKDDDEINEMTLLVGDNGSGKSSILQAIIMLIAQESQKNYVTKLALPGFDLAYIQTGNMPVRIQAQMSVSEEELIATQDYAQQLRSRGENITLPNLRRNDFVLNFNYNQKKVTTENRGALSGYNHATRLKQFNANYRTLFDNVGTILWYDEHRTMFSLNDSSNNIANIDKLREVLVRASYFHTDVTSGRFEIKEGQQDNFVAMQNIYQRVFPNRRFVGAAPRTDDPTKSDFWLSDGKNQYELGGMSAGERAIFPILMEFALLNINNSIIIIDELELHLHPPLQQTFVDLLPRLGRNNQFIITTHSRSVAAMFSPSQIIKMSDYV
jgi:predicted ATPase